MPHSATVMLGGRQYQVAELRSRPNAAWRARLQVPFESLVAKLQAAEATDLSDAQGLADLVRSVSGTLLGSVDILTGLLFCYSPELAADRERIEAEAYDSELLEAFVAVLGLAYPFGDVAAKIGGLAALGRKRPPTSPSSPSASGAAGTTSSTP